MKSIIQYWLRSGIQIFRVFVAVGMLNACSGEPSKQQAMDRGEKNSIPDVLLTTINGDTIRISSLYTQRPVLLSVYLGSGCPMCMMNLKNLSQHAARIQSYGWQIVALSNDTPEENRSALESKSVDSGFIQPGGAFDIPLYSDNDHKAMEMLRCYRRNLDTERHGVFLIDQHGVVRFSAIDRRPFEDYELLMDSLRTIKLIASKPL